MVTGIRQFFSGSMSFGTGNLKHLHSAYSEWSVKLFNFTFNCIELFYLISKVTFKSREMCIEKYGKPVDWDSENALASWRFICLAVQLHLSIRRLVKTWSQGGSDWNYSSCSHWNYVYISNVPTHSEYCKFDNPLNCSVSLPLSLITAGCPHQEESLLSRFLGLCESLPFLSSLTMTLPAFLDLENKICGGQKSLLVT